MQPFFVDSYAALTEQAVTHLLSVSGGRLPLCWGRYIDADLSHDIEVAAAHGIPLLLIARRSARVPLGYAAGAADGAADRARFEHWLEVARAAGASVLRRVFLDVEMEPTMSADYWRGWSGAFDGSEFLPAAYMPNRDNWPASWLSLESAVAGGARCFGVWVAYYHQPVDGSAVLRDEPWSKRPLASDRVPYLAHQHSGNCYGKRYDFSSVSPDDSGWLADVLPTPPDTLRSPEFPRADSITAPLGASFIAEVTS